MWGPLLASSHTNTLPLLERAHVVEHQLVEQLLPCWLPHCLQHQVSAAIFLKKSDVILVKT
jgi:hypothetical protein